MKTTTPMLIAMLATLVSGLTGCASTTSAMPPGMRYASAGPMKLIEGPSVAPPANDIPESKRREWIDAQRPKVVVVREPVRVERVVVRDVRAAAWEYDNRWAWSLPIAFGLGYWGGHHWHDHGYSHGYYRRH